MNKIQQKEFTSLIDKYSSSEGLNETDLPGVSLFRASSTEMPVPDVYEPSLCFIAQGYKQVMLDKEIYRYGPSQYLIVSVDLSIVSQIMKVSKDNPYLLLIIDIDLQQLAELLLHTGHSIPFRDKTYRGLFVGRVDEEIGDCVLRLTRLLGGTPEDIAVLAAQTMREIYYRLLSSDYGEPLAQIALKGSHMQRIASAIRKIKTDYQQHISVDELAQLAGMSVSSFHAHFKSVTAMSPLQFQKSIRLIKARNLMVADEMDATSTAYHVGYESPSQFNREYARMFGNPPRRDRELHKLD